MIGFSHRPTTGKGKLLDELLDLFIICVYFVTKQTSQ